MESSKKLDLWVRSHCTTRTARVLFFFILPLFLKKFKISLDFSFMK